MGLPGLTTLGLWSESKRQNRLPTALGHIPEILGLGLHSRTNISTYMSHRSIFPKVPCVTPHAAPLTPPPPTARLLWFSQDGRRRYCPHHIIHFLHYLINGSGNWHRRTTEVPSGSDLYLDPTKQYDSFSSFYHSESWQRQEAGRKGRTEMARKISEGRDRGERKGEQSGVKGIVRRRG